MSAAGAVLLDPVPDTRRMESAVRDRLERDLMTDFHLRQVGRGHLAIIVSLVSDAPAAPSSYKARLTGIPGLSHVTVEVEACPGDHPHLRKAE